MSAAMETTRPDDPRTALGQTLAGVLDGATITELQRLSGGASRETWRFLADGVPRIVQRQRAGDQRDMMIEADVVRAAGAGGVPVPELLAAEQQADGASFMILEAIEGETIARKIQRDDEFAVARTRLVPDLGGRWLASTHSIPSRCRVSSSPTRSPTTRTCSTRSATRTRPWRWCGTG